MTRIKESVHGSTPFQRLIGHNKEVMKAWSQLGNSLEQDGLLTASLKEQVRRTMAEGNYCEYCKAKGKPEPKLYDEKMALAVGFAQVYSHYPKGNVPDNIFNTLSECFSDEEISELLTFICFTHAQQSFGALMMLKP